MVRAGFYGVDPHRRQRFKCIPRNGDVPHRFAPDLPRQLAEVSHCSDCSSQLDVWEGQAGARLYRYDARAVARALVKAAEGASYRRASVLARRAYRGGSISPWERNGQLVANWVDVFTPLVTFEDLPSYWPDVIVVDSKRFQTGSGPPAPAWHLLVAAGVPLGAPVSEPWVALPSPYLNTHAWERFFGHMRGQPRLVVCDMEHAIRRAVRNVWPGTQVYLCEHHVYERLRPAFGNLQASHPIRDQLFGQAFESVGDWDAFVAAVQHEHVHGTSLTLAARLIRSVGRDLREQIANRETGDPRSNGAAETLVRELSRHLPRNRANRMGNLYRTTHLIKLMLAAQRGLANEVTWAVRLRRYLEGHRGAMPLHQRPHDDPAGRPSLHL